MKSTQTSASLDFSFLLKSLISFKCENWLLYGSIIMIFSSIEILVSGGTWFKFLVLLVMDFVIN